MLDHLARNWWALALRGLVAILFGVLALLWPGLTLLALVFLFGAYVLVDGIVALLSALRAAQRHRRWGMLLLEGLAGIVAGILTFVWPGITTIVLLYLIAAWAVVTGILEVVTAIALREELRGEWLLGLSGVASVVFGILLFAQPGAGAVALVWLIGWYAIIFGILLLAVAFRLRGWARRNLVGPTASPFAPR
jgi:uncharacterized membrane protein HdeD (DUF308 family)